MADKDTTSFGSPAPGGHPHQVHVAPGVDLAAAAYAAGVQSRRRAAAGLPKYTEPVGGGEGPPIPHLDAPAAEGATMAAQAAHQRPQQQQPSIIAQPAPPQGIVAPGTAVAPPNLNIMPTDLLPQQATQDPMYRQGNGAMFAASQPQLAARYGVMRNGQHVPPQALMAPATRQAGGAQSAADAGLRPETLQGLQALQQHNTPAVPLKAPEAPTAVGSADSTDAAQHAGKSPDVPLTDDQRAEVDKELEKLDDFDYESLREAVRHDELNNASQRKIIEARLEPLDIGELIMKNRVTQDVPIILDAAGKPKFVATFTSATAEEDLALKRLLMVESQSIEATERYLLDKFAFMSLTCGVTKINNNPLPGHTNDKGDFDEEAFWKKFTWLMKKPVHMLASIGANYFWFEQRVRTLFKAEKVGNG